MRLSLPVKLAVTAAAAALPLLAHGADAAQLAATDLARGKYLVVIGGCNDCHTPGYAFHDGKVPETDWLTGDSLGWRGPWGTTYATNLRQYMQGLTEAQWIAKAKVLETRPPMPWFNLRQMTAQDLRAIYRYVRHLGAAGGTAPAYVPPDKDPAPPFVSFPSPAK